MMKNIAVVLAAGSGSRFGGQMPKQFIDLNGRMVIDYSIETFIQCPAIDEVAVVVHPDYFELICDEIDLRKWDKVHNIIEGGKERYLSSVNALSSLYDSDDDTNIIFHDAARPWLSPAIVNRVVAALEKYEAVGVGIPTTDTVWEVVSSGSSSTVISRIPDRPRIYRAQTPQAFRYPLIHRAYQRALLDPGFRATDDCGVLLKYMPDIEIHVVEGDEANRKITFSYDL